MRIPYPQTVNSALGDLENEMIREEMQEKEQKVSFEYVEKKSYSEPSAIDLQDYLLR